VEAGGQGDGAFRLASEIEATSIQGDTAMKVTFTGRNLVVTPAIKDFTQERLERLERVLEGIKEAHVVLVTEKYRHIAEIVVKGNRILLSGTQETEDMYGSIGKAIDKIEHQAKKRREKRVGAARRSTGRRPAAGTGNGSGPAGVEEEEVVATLEGGQVMVRDEDYPRKPITVEEAALMLVDGKRPFLVFRDAATRRVGVVYRRSDGHLGLVLPEA
jgi:putative sigma-54 modulation protein